MQGKVTRQCPQITIVEERKVSRSGRFEPRSFQALTSRAPQSPLGPSRLTGSLHALASSLSGLLVPSYASVSWDFKQAHLLLQFIREFLGGGNTGVLVVTPEAQTCNGQRESWFIGGCRGGRGHAKHGFSRNCRPGPTLDR